MPLGNLTSQFFANIYLHELDCFVKHNLRAKFYIRYVDDFIILDKSKAKLIKWKQEIDEFLKETLKLELHSEKSKIVSLSRGIDFVGFRNYYYFKLLRKRSVRKMGLGIKCFNNNELNYSSLCEIFQGWNAHTKHTNSFKLRKSFAGMIARINHSKISTPKI